MDSMALCEYCVPIESSISFAKQYRFLQSKITVDGDFYEKKFTFVIVITITGLFFKNKELQCCSKYVFFILLI